MLRLLLFSSPIFFHYYYFFRSSTVSFNHGYAVSAPRTLLAKWHNVLWRNSSSSIPDLFSTFWLIVNFSLSRFFFFLALWLVQMRSRIAIFHVLFIIWISMAKHPESAQWIFPGMFMHGLYWTIKSRIFDLLAFGWNTKTAR